MSKIRVMILTGYGLNCDYETAYAFELAGAAAQRVHINDLIDGAIALDDFQIMVFGGGFSWADDHGAGVVQAVRMRTHLGEHLHQFIDRGNLVLGICNGFQTLVNMGLLPGFDQDYSTRAVALTYNDGGTYRDAWVSLKTNPQSPCVFTAGLDLIELPVRHGEGKFYAEDAVIEQLAQHQQIALYYVRPDGSPAAQRFPHNPNGSVRDIAGICDTTGRVFGLMPHPEAFNHWTNHPAWPQTRETLRRTASAKPQGLTPGVQMLKNAVAYLQS